MAQADNQKPRTYWPQQSPIGLSVGGSYRVDFPSTFFGYDYADAPYEGRFVEEGGHYNFELTPPYRGRAPTITLGGVEAKLVKIHMHTPSEHHVGGRPLDGEIHLIHEIVRPTEGSTHVVLGVFLAKARTCSSAMKGFVESWMRGLEGGTVEIDPRCLLPADTDQWYRYEGSLTTGSYAEVVSWLVFVEPADLDSESLELIEKRANDPPERPPQASSRRFVLRSFG